EIAPRTQKDLQSYKYQTSNPHLAHQRRHKHQDILIFLCTRWIRTQNNITLALSSRSTQKISPGTIGTNHGALLRKQLRLLLYSL
ncbi:unnamed protein product, partial [Linum tenue]